MRPRLVIWAGVAAIGLSALTVIAFGATSSMWYCTDVCHQVQGDAVAAYRRSPHAKVPCITCHEPVNADPVSFALHRVRALDRVARTVGGGYRLPLNPASDLAMDSKKMGSEQCTQCHDMSVRAVTPSPGISIDHEVHEKNGIHCAACHNRAAHVENLESAQPDASGDASRPREDFMQMAGCFRCHTLDGTSVLGQPAPGECTVCHSADFPLKPANHLVEGFYSVGGPSTGHWQLKEARPGYCRTCHVESEFCVGCHGLEMPHSDDFAADHGSAGRQAPDSCARCHAVRGADAAGSDEFCNACHHPQANPSKTWVEQHWEIVRANGAEPCFACHKPNYCAACHVSALN